MIITTMVICMHVTLFPWRYIQFLINVTSDGQRFEVAPILDIVPVQSGEGTLSFYDNANKRLWRWTMIIRKIPHVLLFWRDCRFQAETGRDMVYMDWTKDNYTFALLEDPEDEEMYVYGIGVGDNGINERKYYMKLNRPNKDKLRMLHFICIIGIYSIRPRMQFKFDMEYPETPAKAVLSFPGESFIYNFKS